MEPPFTINIAFQGILTRHKVMPRNQIDASVIAINSMGGTKNDLSFKAIILGSCLGALVLP